MSTTGNLPKDMPTGPLWPLLLRKRERKTDNTFSSELCAADLTVCAACDDVLELFQIITGGRNVLLLSFTIETWHLCLHKLLALLASRKKVKKTSPS